MNYTIISAASMGQTSFMGKDGQQVILDKYMLMLTDESGKSLAAELSQKPGKPAPKSGEAIRGTIEETKYGNKFKREQGIVGGSFGGRGRSQEERDEIMRQHALSQAIIYITEKAKYLSQKDALKFITGKEVLQVASYFHRYTRGAETVVNMAPPAVPSLTEPAQQSLVDNFKKVIEPEYPPTPEIALDDIPF